MRELEDIVNRTGLASTHLAWKGVEVYEMVSHYGILNEDELKAIRERIECAAFQEQLQLGLLDYQASCERLVIRLYTMRALHILTDKDGDDVLRVVEQPEVQEFLKKQVRWKLTRPADAQQRLEELHALFSIQQLMTSPRRPKRSATL